MIKEFRVGDVLGSSFKVLFANFLPFMLIALVLQSPASAYDVYLALHPEIVEPNLQLLWGSILVSLILGPVVTGAITFGVLQQLRSKHASLADCVMKGVSRLLPVLGVAICVGLAIVLGTILLIIPGIIIACMLWVAIPVAVVEDVGVGGALNRSAELTKGSRWSVFGLFIIIFLLKLAVAIAIGAFLVAADSPTVNAISLFVMGAIFTAWQASAQAVSYYHLRSAKETIDVDEIASVFD